MGNYSFPLGRQKEVASTPTWTLAPPHLECPPPHLECPADALEVMRAEVPEGNAGGLYHGVRHAVVAHGTRTHNVVHLGLACDTARAVHHTATVVQPRCRAQHSTQAGRRLSG